MYVKFIYNRNCTLTIKQENKNAKCFEYKNDKEWFFEQYKLGTVY